MFSVLNIQEKHFCLKVIIARLTCLLFKKIMEWWDENYLVRNFVEEKWSYEPKKHHFSCKIWGWWQSCAWECCSGNGMDHLFKSSWTMEKKSTMIFERKIFYLFRRWHFPIQDYNDSEHTNALKNCLKDKISILPWHAMYLNLNPIENLWQKLRLHTRQH